MEIKDLYKSLKNKTKKIAIVGLGYVGLPLLVNFSKHYNVIGFDVNKEKINNLKNGKDDNEDVETDKLSSVDCLFSSNAVDLSNANFFIIAVPTPIDEYKNPDLSYIQRATALVGKYMPRGSIIVYESTVYPGVTEDFCIPILEKESNLQNGKDFYVGYSPERLNPGDQEHTIENIVKVVSAQDKDSLEIISKVYGEIVKAGIFKAKSIRVAEAAKVIENTQRDLNVALINELAILFSRMGIKTKDVLEAARTKWNFLDFSPGLVGGHCIGVDPYYLTFKAKELGYYPEVILAGRKINDNMAFFIGDQILKKLLNVKKLEGKIKVILFGLSFKENIKDIRNSKVPDIYNFLIKNGIDVAVFDPVVSKEEAKKVYNIDIIEYQEIKNANAVVFCVAHDYFKNMDLGILKSQLKIERPYLFDIKGIFQRDTVEKEGYRYWSL